MKTMKKIIALLLFTTFGYSQTYTPVRSTLHDNIKLKTPPTITGETKALVRNSSTGQVSEQVITTASIPDASETVAGKVSVGTQTFGGNKTIIGESATVGNAFEVQNLSHEKLLQIANNKSVGLNVNPISNIGLSVGRGVFGGVGSSNFTVFADNTGTDRVLDVTNSQLIMYKGIYGALDLPITANVALSFLYNNATNGSITIGTSTTNGTHAVISNFERNRVSISTPITPPAGSSNGVYNCLDFRSTIDLTNISGTAMVRGYYIHPTLTGLTSAKVFRAIETSEGGGYFNVGATTNVQSSAILQSDSTTKGFLPPRMTTAQKNAIVTPVEGLMVFDTTLMKLCIFTTVWETITSI
jgi:hypothetical protein